MHLALCLVQGKHRTKIIVPWPCSYRGEKTAMFQGWQWSEFSISLFFSFFFFFCIFFCFLGPCLHHVEIPRLGVRQLEL